MKRALEAALVLAKMLPPSKIEAVISRLAAGSVVSSVTGLVGSYEAKQALAEYYDAVSEAGISWDAAAAMLASSSHAHQATIGEQTIELVVTGPSTPFVATRRTEQVLLDLIRKARSELFLVSFVAGNWIQVIKALIEAHERGVKVRVLMEASKHDGGTLKTDQSIELVKAFPAVKTYRWTEKDAEYAGGKVHAKIALADDDLAFISSANFTGHAMEKNFEAGVLLRGGHIPLDIWRHLHGLIETRIITRVDT